MDKKSGLDLKKVVGGIVVFIALALGIIHPSDFISNDNATQSTQVTQSTEVTQNVTSASTQEIDEVPESTVTFRNQNLLDQHYQKHGIEMGFASAAEYETAAAAVVMNQKALHKIEEEDGDDVYYIEETNEFVVVSKDGYLRTYFNPSSGIKYYNRQ